MANTTKYVRYALQGQAGYGILEGEVIHELNANFVTGGTPTGKNVSLSEVRLLAPVQPSKIIAVGLNYRSHLGGRTAPPEPGIFAKMPSCIVGPEDDVVIPADARDVHYEGEMVVVVGKTAKGIAEKEAGDYIFGITAGNDISERAWQKGDLQWLRAKGADTFGPLGPTVVRGLDYNDLLVATRLNGQVRQSQRTTDLIFGVDAVVSYISRFVTLLPGDLIFTGTPGTTSAMKPGDVVEVEVEGVGILRNTIR
jgi:2-keto-4-pentenoate hydratase/2-oxohepta-3-ene-1,7-dioic acid hydratase in catechol pathway